MASGILAILGSGETAPGMTKVHRVLISRLDPVRAVNLDSAYGFQENVPQMSEKLEEYFQISLQTKLETLHFAHFEASSELEQALFKERVRQANYVFAGPGSPSFALSQWAPLDFASDLLAVLDASGTLCISSAAALTLGAFTAPIYEIYKAGVEPYWLTGLNILANFGLNCVVIPHFDNNEGENYDTSRCYLGERRLRLLETQLPPDVATFGIDEHTAVIIDFEADSLSVQGRANAYWRHGDDVRILENATTVALSELRTVQVNKRSTGLVETPAKTDEPEELGRVAIENQVGSREAVARLVLLAKSGAEGFIDPTPLITGILDARKVARTTNQFDLADQLRDVLITAGVKVNDSPEGTTWSLE